MLSDLQEFPAKYVHACPTYLLHRVPPLKQVKRATCAISRDVSVPSICRCSAPAFLLPLYLSLVQTQRILEDQQLRMKKKMKEMKQQEDDRRRKVQCSPLHLLTCGAYSTRTTQVHLQGIGTTRHTHLGTQQFTMHDSTPRMSVSSYRR